MGHENERRGYPRIQDDNVSLYVKVGPSDTMSHTLNISASGVYCKIDKELPIMSRVKVVLMIPLMAGNEKEELKRLEVDGVVVRQHPVIIDGKIKHYDVAIFFDDCSEKARELISHYIARRANHKTA